jgi:hypothetical protein
MAIISFITGWVLGLIIASFTLGQIGIILLFALPATKKLRIKGFLKEDSPVEKHRASGVF